MRVLTVCREAPQNAALHNNPIAEFIFEQNRAIEKFSVEFDYYLFKEGGFKGYIKEIHNFKMYLKEKNYSYDIVHAHGGHIGSLVNAQRKIPVITTYHGSDINNPINRLISLVSLLFSKANIFVSSKMFHKVQKYIRGIVIPCGVDFNVFQPLNKLECRKELGFNDNEKIVLFAGRRERKEKNYNLAKEASDMANVPNFIELKGFSRNNVVKLINAIDCVLLTSVSEGSPQVIKEAMACNCPIVATDVGDIKDVINDTEGCFITSFDPSDVAKKINLALQFNKRTNGREMIKRFDNELIAKENYKIYNHVITKTRDYNN